MALADGVSALATRISTEFNSIRTALAGKADTGAGVSIAQLPAGEVLSVKYNGGWPARPTARTDITVLYFASASSNPDPTDFVAGTDYRIDPV